MVQKYFLTFRLLQSFKSKPKKFNKVNLYTEFRKSTKDFFLPCTYTCEIYIDIRIYLNNRNKYFC